MIINNIIIWGVILILNQESQNPGASLMIPPAGREISPGVNLGTELNDRFFAFLSSWSSGPTNNQQYEHQSSLAIIFFVHESIFPFRRRPYLCRTTSSLSRLSHKQVIQRGWRCLSLFLLFVESSILKPLSEDPLVGFRPAEPESFFFQNPAIFAIEISRSSARTQNPKAATAESKDKAILWREIVTHPRERWFLRSQQRVSVPGWQKKSLTVCRSEDVRNGIVVQRHHQSQKNRKVFFKWSDQNWLRSFKNQNQDKVKPESPVFGITSAMLWPNPPHTDYHIAADKT